MSRRYTIGRERSCDVPIADDSVSRLHAEIWLAEDGAVMMADSGSSNGTTLIRGGQSFPLRHEVVMPADQVRLGEITLRVSDVIEAVEIQNPGVLTSRAAVAPARGPGPPPPPPNPRAAGGALVRCECGAIKKSGQVCPGCHR